MVDEQVDQLNVYLHAAADAVVPAAADVADEVDTERGRTTHFVVSYAQSLGGNGPTMADAVLATCEADYNRLQGWFGNINIASLPFRVFIRPGANGASHATCSATSLTCNAFNGTDADLIRSLVVAEADEVFMANQGTGWNCGGSNGEALSRILAAEIYPNELTPPGLGVTFATAASWLDSPTRPDFVNTSEGTDRNFVSIGCGTLFINWLRFQLGYTLEQIVQTAGSTLAETYRRLTNRPDAWQRFSSIMAANFPAGRPSGLRNDNPFPLGDGRQASFAVARTPNHLDLFWVGPDGAIGSTWWDAAPGAGWGDHRPFPVTPSGEAQAQSPVAVVARQTGHLDNFWGSGRRCGQLIAGSSRLSGAFGVV